MVEENSIIPPPPGNIGLIERNMKSKSSLSEFELLSIPNELT